MKAVRCCLLLLRHTRLSRCVASLPYAESRTSGKSTKHRGLPPLTPGDDSIVYKFGKIGTYLSGSEGMEQ